MIALLDAQIDELLQPYADPAWRRVPEARRQELERFVERAQRRSEEVSWLSYLSLGERLALVRDLSLGPERGLDLGGDQEHAVIVSVRNDIAHGRPPGSRGDVIEALVLSERLLDTLIRGAPAAEA